MKVPTNLNQTLSSVETQKIDYDNNIKALLADIQILSRIIKYTVREVQMLSIEEIAESLSRATIEVGKTPIDPGLTNAGKVLSEHTEDIILNEGYITFDVRLTFTCKKQNIRIVLNVEAQKKSSLSQLEYHIESRMVYYLSRLISSQKNVEFFKDDYDNIKNVYSIWICTDTAIDGDSICEYSLKPEIVYGKANPSSCADKMKGIIVHIRKDTNVEESKNQLIVMLEDLLKNNSKDEKKKALVEKHGMKMSVELEGRIAEMCNLSENLIEEGIEKGIEKGRTIAFIDMVISFLEGKGALSKEQEARIRNEKNTETLRNWVELASQVSSVEQFLSEM